MGAIKNRLFPTKASAESTILGSAEPMRDEERKKLKDERRARALNLLLFEASYDKDFACALCEKVGNLAQGDAALRAALKSSLTNVRPGRSVEWSMERYETLIWHYAHAILEMEGDHGRVLKVLVEYEKRMTGKILSSRTIDNKISVGINELEEAGKLNELLSNAEWVKDAIQKRRDRASKAPHS